MVFAKFLHKACFILIAFASFAGGAENEEIKALISGLGDNSYNKREESVDCLRKLGYAALASLENHFKDEDTEVAMRCREIHTEYMHLTDACGEIPSIWFLDTEHRFPAGCEVSYSKDGSLCSIKTKLDVSSDYYQRARMTLIVSKSIYEYYEFFSCWRNTRISKLATRMYIEDELKRGTSKEELRFRVQKASDNANSKDLVFQTRDLDKKALDFWMVPPGVLVVKEKFTFPSR